LLATIKKTVQNNFDCISLKIGKNELMAKRFVGRKGTSILFVVDASGSMGVEELMSKTKGIIFNLLKDAYIKRERVGMITFRGTEANVILPLTRSVTVAKQKLKDIKTGGKTPLSMALKKAIEEVERENKKFKDNEKIIMFFTDGRANISITNCDPFDEAIFFAEKIAEMDVKTFVVDTDPTWISYPYAKDLAKKMNAKYYKLEDVLKRNIREFIYK